MRNIIIYTFTPFQVITALAIKCCYFQYDKADLILDDSISERIYIKENILDSKSFDHVYFTNRGKYFNKYKNRLHHEWWRFASSVNPAVLTKTDDYSENNYDLMITTEIDYWTESIYFNLRHINPNINVSLMDEGYSSYTYFFREKYRPQLLKNIIKKFSLDMCELFGLRYSIAKQAKILYLFEPELNCWENIPYEIKQIDVQDKVEFLETVNRSFGFDKRYASKLNEYASPFIYFEESFFWSNRNNNDIEIILKIVEIVGKSNLVIKLHPRNKINRFEKFGLKTNNTIGVPWELFAINTVNTETTYITFSSGAVLNYKFLVNKSIRTILLYKCIGDKYYHVDISTKEWFEKFRKKYPDMLLIPETLNELYDCLKEL